MYLTKYKTSYITQNGKNILYNTLNTHKISLSKDIITKIANSKNLDFLNCNKELFKEFREKKYIFNNKEDEERFVKTLYDKKIASQNNTSLTLFLHLTYDCNLSCSYCNYVNISNDKPVMSVDKIKSAFAGFSNIIENGNYKDITLVLFGGEPFMPRNIKEILTFFETYNKFINDARYKDKVFSLIIFSNAVEIPHFKQLILKYRNIITSIYITFNGTKENHNKTRIFKNGTGSYDYVIKGIKFLLDNNVNMWLVFNADKSSIQDLKSLYDTIYCNSWKKHRSYKGCCVSRIKNRNDNSFKTYAEYEMLDDIKSLCLKYGKDLDISYFNFEDLRITKNIMRYFRNDESRKYFHQFYGCGNRIIQYSFDLDGYIYPCSPAAGEHGYNIGTFYPSLRIDTELNKCWTHRNVLDLDPCKNCSMVFLCGGGCPLAASQKNKDIMKPECPKAEEVFHKYLNCLENNIKINNVETIYDKSFNY